MSNWKHGYWAIVAGCLVAMTPTTAAARSQFGDGPPPQFFSSEEWRAIFDGAREGVEQGQRQAEQAREREERNREREIERAAERLGRDRERFETLYERGQDALENAQWSQAVERFTALAALGTSRSDAAMYWRAYALDKLNQQSDALTTVAEMLKRFPTSRWIGDARALEIQVRQRSGQPVSPTAEADEDLKLLALQGLQHSDPEQAVPMLEKFLQGNQSPRLKERALFVLAQSESARARQVMEGIARGGSNPDLQRKALQYLGMRGTTQNRQLLAEVYAASNDVDVKRQILRSFMRAGDRERVLAAATSEKVPELRAEAVRQLGAMRAREELWQLYQKESSVDVKRQILQGIFVGGDSTRLVEIANTEKSPELRRLAVRHLGPMGAQRTGDALLAIYAKQTDPDVRRAAIDGLFVQNNADALVSLARKENDAEMRKQIVGKLSLMRSKVAVDYMMEILNK